MKTENIIKIINTSGKEIEHNGKIPNHAYVFFRCEECGKEAKKQYRRIKEQDEKLLCSTCSKKHSSIKKYGVSHPSKSKEVKKHIGSNGKNIELMKETMLKKYGVDNASKIKDFIDKRQKTKRLKLLPILKKKLLSENIEALFDIEKYIGQRIDDKNIEYHFKCLICNNIYKGTLNGHIPRCPICFPSSSSFLEKEIVSFLKENYSEEIIENTKKIIPPYELDIYLPNKNLAIEFDGLYWHSELDKNYHLNKTKMCNNIGIDLIHIFEDEWIDKKEIVKKILLSKINNSERIYARKCKIVEINNKDAFAFQEENHLQGGINSKINLALLYDNNIVANLSLSKSRFNKNFEWEITRFCFSINIVGGFGKLLKFFERKCSPSSIITYSDKRFFKGNIYLKNGFTFLRETEPNYFYYKSNKRYSRNKFQKHKLNKLIENFDKNLTEKENMLNNGFKIIYDCGNFVFIKKYN